MEDIEGVTPELLSFVDEINTEWERTAANKKKKSSESNNTESNDDTKSNNTTESSNEKNDPSESNNESESNNTTDEPSNTNESNITKGNTERNTGYSKILGGLDRFDSRVPTITIGSREIVTGSKAIYNLKERLLMLQEIKKRKTGMELVHAIKKLFGKENLFFHAKKIICDETEECLIKHLIKRYNLKDNLLKEAKKFVKIFEAKKGITSHDPIIPTAIKYLHMINDTDFSNIVLIPDPPILHPSIHIKCQTIKLPIKFNIQSLSKYDALAEVLLTLEIELTIYLSALETWYDSIASQLSLLSKEI
jgi:hypothetical protein